MKNIELKIVSVAAACVLAFLVRTVLSPVEQGTSVLQILLPVEVKNLPANMTIVEPQVRQVEVTLQGPSTMLAKVAAAPPVYKIDLPQDLPSEITIPVSNEQLHVLDGISIVSIRPADFVFKFDEIISIDMPINVNKTGVINDNFVLSKLEAKPAKVTVRGPRQQFKGLGKIETEPFDLSDLNETETKELQLKAINPRLNFVDVSSVEVQAVVEPVVATWSIKGIPVAVENSPTARVQPDTISITLSGPKALKQDFDAKGLTASVTLSAEKQTPKIAGLPETIQIKSVDEVLTILPTPQPQPSPTLNKFDVIKKTTQSATQGKVAAGKVR